MSVRSVRSSTCPGPGSVSSWGSRRTCRGAAKTTRTAEGILPALLQDAGDLSLRLGNAGVDEGGIAADGGDLAAQADPLPRLLGGAGEDAERDVGPQAGFQGSPDRRFHLRGLP